MATGVDKLIPDSSTFLGHLRMGHVARTQADMVREVFNNNQKIQKSEPAANFIYF